MEVVIRPALSENLEEISELYCSIWKEHGWSVDKALAYFGWVFGCDGKVFFVAESDGKIIGAVSGIVRPWIKGPALNEVDLFVDPNYHGQKVGKKLMQSIVSEAVEKHDAYLVILAADGTKTFPLGWYNRLGYETGDWILLESDAKLVLNNLS